jgi:hypothetical protein
MAIFRTLVAGALLALALPVSAQDAIERAMSAEEFRAAGLHKLSAAELAKLNTWLNRTVETASAEAAKKAKKKVEDDNRGFLSFGSTEPVVARLTGEFRGYARGREYKLDNGQVWKQVDEASLAGVRVDAPEVHISPSLVGNTWYMAIKGYNTRAKVQRVE